MKKILIATPMYPPTSGGPGTHAKKLIQHFRESENYSARLFNFENLNKYPPILRHVIGFYRLFKMSKDIEIIFALDGFTVAFLSIVLSKLKNIPVVLRIGGDLVHEQYAEKVLIDMQSFYEKLESGKIKLTLKENIKFLIQRFVISFSDGIIFNTDWQRDMYRVSYHFENQEKRNLVYTLYNPLDESKDLSEYIKNDVETENYKFTCITRKVPFKNLNRIEKIINEINSDGKYKINLVTKNTKTHEECLREIGEARVNISAAISDIAPNQLLEALSLQVPCIATKNTGLYEPLKDIKSIIWIDPYSEESIKEAIEKMCEKEYYLEMKTAAKAFNWPYKWEEYFQKYEEIIEKLT